MKSEQMGHRNFHLNVYNKVEVTMSTHDVKGLSKKDIDMANFMNSIYNT